MADEKVDLVLSHPHGSNLSGDRISVEAGEARRLVAAGIALYATKAAAKSAEGDAGGEKTVRASRSRNAGD